MSTETTKKKIKIDNGTNFARAYTDKAIDAKLPTDLKATATSLSLLAGSTKIGSGINLSGFEYDEATKTLKASGGGKSVSPCLNLMDMTTDPPTVRTTITEEEKTNLENGLYTSVLYADLSSGSVGFYSMHFPETAVFAGNVLSFSTFNFSVDDATEAATIFSSSSYCLMIGEKNADGTYPITIEKIIEAPFGGGSGGGGSFFEKATLSQLSGFRGQYKALHITDCSVTFNFLETEEITINSVYFVGFVSSDTQLEGTVWIISGSTTVCLCTGTFFITDGVINGGHCVIGNLNSVSVGSLLTFGANRSFNSKDATNAISLFSLYGGQGCEYAGKVDVVSNGATAKKLALTIISNVNKEATGESVFCEMDGLFEGYGLGRMVLKKDADNIPQFKSFTTWLPPVTSADEGKSLVIKNGNAQWTDLTSIHNHTIVIKEGSKIIFAANKELASATPATTLETLISTFKDTTTAGFGDYILLTVDTTAKLTKQDGTETDLSTLTVTISDTVK